MILIYGKDMCEYCDKAKEVCRQYGFDFKYFSVDDRFEGEKNLAELKERVDTEGIQIKTVPQIWRNGKYIGGYTELLTNIEDTGSYGQGRI